MFRKSDLLKWLFEINDLLPSAFRALFVFGLAVNVLLLVSPLYMLQIYDRVLSSGSFDSLLWLTLIAVFLLAVYAMAEMGRRRIAALAAQALDSHFQGRIFARFERGLDDRPALMADAQQLNRLTGVFQNGTVIAFFDLPFAPLFMVLLFLLHPLLGLVGLGGALVVFALAVRAEASTRANGQAAAAGSAAALEFAGGLVRQRSAMIAMGIGARAYAKWLELRARAAVFADRAADGEGSHAGTSRSLRQILQILVLATGAGLALVQAISPGAIVAASILVARALAPIDQITGGWRQLVQARAAWEDLSERLASVEPELAYTPLPRPEPVVAIERLAVELPNAREALIRSFTYTIPAGRKVAVVGQNGSGKSALLQTLAGVWPSGGGSVALGGRDIHAWSSGDRGGHVGYVPQDIELMSATVAENIARLATGEADAMLDAARRAGAHDAILGLPQGYDTIVGPGGTQVSRGQTQLIGLARALYGDPVLLLLDEPTANLDPDSAARVIGALGQFSGAGGIVIAASHDPRLVAAMDVVLTIRRGAVEEVSAAEYAAAAERRLSVISATPGAA